MPDLSRQAENWSRIAPHWYGVRHYTIFPSELSELAKRWQGGNLLNVGCGHGADFLPFREGFTLAGVDHAPGMLEMARKYAVKHGFTADLKQADARTLPFPPASFDFALAVAVYHHLPGRAQQMEALRELYRVLKPGGEAFLAVWNRWQRRFWGKPREVAVPFRTPEGVVSRYYYLFSYGEIEKLARAAGFLVLKSCPEASWRLPVRWPSRNICLLIKKPN
jgi:tRNA (uracil-5-)-methyltransferase TRM9